MVRDKAANAAHRKCGHIGKVRARDRARAQLCREDPFGVSENSHYLYHTVTSRTAVIKNPDDFSSGAYTKQKIDLLSSFHFDLDLLCCYPIIIKI